MKFWITVDNTGKEERFGCEWGFSLVFEKDGNLYLVDGGTSGTVLMENLHQLHLDPGTFAAAILSHAHYDHANGLQALLQKYKDLPLYLSSNAQENCYDTRHNPIRYIGMAKGFLENTQSHLHPVSIKTQIAPGIWILPHTLLPEHGTKGMVLQQPDGSWISDTFQHEITLVIESEKGLILVNSCSHAGMDTILQEAKAAFPDQKLYAYIGGLHLFRADDTAIEHIIETIEASGLEKVITGHCTGEHAMDLLQNRLPHIVTESQAGMILDL